MAKTAKMQEVSIDDLVPYERNAKTHDAAQIEKLKASMQEFGFISPILIDEQKNIIAGHGRVMAARELGLKTVPAVYVEGLTEAQRKAYIIADNRLTELGGWDMQAVQSELQELEAEGFDTKITGFDLEDIVITDDMGADIDEDKSVPDQPEKRTERGDIWKLGDHRLMCGDSTNPQDVEALMAGQLADLVVTDPPYNVALGKNKGHIMRPSEAREIHRRTDGLVIENDDWEDDEEFIHFLYKAFVNLRDSLKAGGSFYIWHASNQAANFLEAIRESQLRIRQSLIWVKQAFALGRQDYQWRHEPCFYGWKDGAAHYFIDVRSLTTVVDRTEDLSRDELMQAYKELSSITDAIHEDRPTVSDLHPTMKSVGLFKKLIRNSSREGDLVLDLFGGSGTTIMAAEEMGRRCYTMEFDPHYCDVIISRWEETTGRKAVRVDV